MSLSEKQRSDWDRDGVLILPRFFSDAEVSVLERSLQRAWDERFHVPVDDLNTNQRLKLGQVQAADRREHHFKVNDLYLEFEELRDISLHPKMVPVLAQLLGGHSPVLCTTLSLDFSTQQENHIDSLYMTPRTVGHLVAHWVALEDVHPDAGPLRYFPGSHLLPLYRFRDGSHRASDEEHPLAIEHIARGLQERGLKEQLFLPKKGDALIWHANLVHGGSAMKNPTMTRKSMVSHFFSETDARALGADLVPLNGGFWLHKQHLVIPGAQAAPVAQSPLRHRIVDALHSRVRSLVPTGVISVARTLISKVVGN